MAEQSAMTGMLEEHKAPDVSTAPTEYTPTTEEKKAIKLVTKLFEKAKRHRKKYDEKWLDFYKMFRGKQWKEQRPSYRHSEVINFIFQAIQSQVPVMTDSRPKFDFLPEEPGDMEFSEILSDVATSDWERGNWLYKLSEAIYDGHFYGTGFLHVKFNPKAKHGLGAIELESADPFYCFPDPNAHQINDERQRSRFFIYAEPVDVDLLKKEYPEKKDYIKADVVDLMQGDKTDLDPVRFKSPTDNKTVLEGTSANDAGSKDQAIKITCYVYDDDFDEEEKPKLDETGQPVVNPLGVPEVIYEQRLKYPHGRKICIAGGILLSDGPMEDHGLIPYAKFVNYILPREFWGISEVEQLESPQKIFNKLISFALDVLTLMGNPIWKVGAGAGVDTDNLFNRPGLIVEAEDINQIQREEGVQLQPYVLQMANQMQEWFNGISGRSDVSQGVRPEGVSAASAITALQEAAQTRMRQKSKNLDATLQDTGTLWQHEALDNYTAPRIFRLTNKDESQKYFKMHIEHQELPDGSVQKTAKVRPYVPDGSGKLVETMAPELGAKDIPLQGGFDVRVTTGSSLPFAKTEKANLATQALQFGAIDTFEWLKAVDWPNAEVVYQEVEGRKLKAMQDQAAASAPPAAPAPEAAPPDGAAPAPEMPMDAGPLPEEVPPEGMV